MGVAFDIAGSFGLCRFIIKLLFPFGTQRARKLAHTRFNQMAEFISSKSISDEMNYSKELRQK